METITLESIRRLRAQVEEGYRTLIPLPEWCGWDQGAGYDQTVYALSAFGGVRHVFTPIDVCRWMGVSYRLLTGEFTPAQRRRNAKRFIREEVARRRMERRAR